MKKCLSSPPATTTTPTPVLRLDDSSSVAAAPSRPLRVPVSVQSLHHSPPPHPLDRHYRLSETKTPSLVSVSSNWPADSRDNVHAPCPLFLPQAASAVSHSLPPSFLPYQGLLGSRSAASCDFAVLGFAPSPSGAETAVLRWSSGAEVTPPSPHQKAGASSRWSSGGWGRGGGCPPSGTSPPHQSC